MPGIGLFEILLFVVIAAVIIAVCHGIAATIRDGEMMHELRLEVHELHRVYLARLRGEDETSMRAYAESDVEPIVGSIERQSQHETSASEAA